MHDVVLALQLAPTAKRFGLDDRCNPSERLRAYLARGSRRIRLSRTWEPMSGANQAGEERWKASPSAQIAVSDRPESVKDEPTHGLLVCPNAWPSCDEAQ